MNSAMNTKVIKTTDSALADNITAVAIVNEKTTALDRRRTALTVEIRTHLDSQRGAEAEQQAAQTALAAAYADGDAEAVQKALERLKKAAEGVASARGLDTLITGLENAIAAVESELSDLSRKARMLADEQRALARQFLRKLAGELADQYSSTAHALVAAQVRARAMSELEELFGGPPAAYAPLAQPAVVLQAIGPDRVERGDIVIHPGSMFASAREEIVAKVRAAGFQVV